jgi:hypothetical protein
VEIRVSLFRDSRNADLGICVEASPDTAGGDGEGVYGFFAGDVGSVKQLQRGRAIRTLSLENLAGGGELDLGGQLLLLRGDNRIDEIDTPSISAESALNMQKMRIRVRRVDI